MTKKLLAALALFSGIALASVTVTQAPTVYEIHFADNSIEKGKPWPTTELECDTRAQAIPGGSCVIRHKFITSSTCADEPAPHIALTRNAADPKTWDEPDAKAVQDPADDTKWRTTQFLYVHNPGWPAGYPNCWIRGDADPDEWCPNGSNPEAVFMQRKDEPGACPNLPNVDEPTGRPVTP